MSRNEKRWSRARAALGALAAVAASAAALATPAGAASGHGEAIIAPADHSKGRTLSGQGVKLLAGSGASERSGRLSLPIGELDPGAEPAASSAANLRFKFGKRSLALTGVHFDLTAGTLAGKLGGTEIPVFKLGAGASVNSGAGSIGLSEGKLRLTADAAAALKQKLGLPRALVRKGVGMIWLSAQASPTHAAARPVVSGSASWGVLASWRAYIYQELGPGSIGSITTDGGATTSGEAAKAGSYFSFPASSGSFEKGLYGASDRLSLKTAGSVIFAKPGHCIKEVKFSDLGLSLGGAASSIALDSVYQTGKVEGMSCAYPPAVTTADVTLAKLDLGAIAPTYSADGKTVTWTAIPATLTAAGGSAWGAGYTEGQVLDPVTISVQLG